MMTVELAGAAWVLPLAFMLQAVAAVLIVLRLIRGPSGADRVVAIDALTLLGAAAVALIALASGRKELLDAAVVLALVAFLGTAAFALMFPSEVAGESDERAAEGAPWRRVAIPGELERARGYRRSVPPWAATRGGPGKEEGA